MKKKRLDELLLERGLTESAARAKTCVMAGLVYVNGQKETTPGAQILPDARLEVRESALPYVSRGGLKLEKALRVFPIPVEGALCADCGASTGGFTDVLLQNGAARVYSIDVGYGQLAWKLRNDPRVVCLERTNLRHVTREQVPEELALAVMDLSFISLRLVLGAVYGLLAPHGQAVCLVKPQFEAEREQVGKKGVVRDPEVHRAVLEEFLRYSAEAGFCLRGMDFSPIRGPEGNIEYLAWLEKDGDVPYTPELCALVAASHAAHGKEEKP